MDEVIDLESLETAKEALHDREQGDAQERLALALCILLDGFLTRAIGDYGMVGVDDGR
jgi:hypothetical protein